MDDILLNKASVIERCLQRIGEEYSGRETELENNYTRQDAIILNLQRACEACIDSAIHLVRVRRLGLPQQSRDAFVLIEEAGLINKDLSRRMQAMVGFRNIALHNYRKLNLSILRSILDERLGDFKEFATRLIALADD